MALASWLFVKGNESVWIERPAGRTMIVAGPGTEREEHDFATDEALDAFQVKLAEQLVERGWFLWAFDRDRRTGHERRAVGRGGPDRRQSARADRGSVGTSSDR